MDILNNTLLVPLRDIKENPDNPRLIKDFKFSQLVDSICEFPKMLYKRPIVVVTDANDNYIALGGNMRLKAIPVALKRLKANIRLYPEKTEQWLANIELLEKGVPVVLADDWTQEERDEFIIKDNVSYGEHDWSILANSWDSEKLMHWGIDIPDIQIEVPKKAEEDGPVPEPPEKPISQPGDVYELNEHRVICGDSRDLATGLLLMHDGDANLSFTSPPYWVGKDYETEKNEKEIDHFIQDIADQLVACTEKDNGRIVINTGTSSINRIDRKRKVEILPLIDKWANSLRKSNWLMRHLRIWVKRGQLPASISPKTDVIDQHNEYIATFEKEYTQVLTYWNPDGDQRGQERIGTPWAQQGVWDDVHGEKSSEGRHNAAFPVEIPFRNILLYTKRKEIVFDCFGGSGTTLIACEQTDRKARLIEIDPRYVDVIVIRWALWMKLHGRPYTIKLNGEKFEPVLD